MRLKILKAYSYDELEEAVNSFIGGMPDHARIIVHLWSAGEFCYASILYNEV